MCIDADKGRICTNMGHSGSSLGKNIYSSIRDNSEHKDFCRCTEDAFNCHDRPDLNCRNFSTLIVNCPIIGCLYGFSPKIKLPTKIAYSEDTVCRNVAMCLKYLYDNYVYHRENDKSINIVVLVTDNFNPLLFKESPFRKMVETIDFICGLLTIDKVDLTHLIDHNQSEILEKFRHLRSLYAEKI